MTTERKYFKPKSTAWWAGLVPLALGVFIAAEPVHGLTTWVNVINNMTGGMSPYILINAGVGFIGLRGMNG